MMMQDAKDDDDNDTNILIYCIYSIIIIKL
jgi:hypothetical protein